MRVFVLAFAIALLAASMSQAEPAPWANTPPIVAATPCDLGAALLKAVAATDGPRGVIYDDAPFQPIRISGTARGNTPPPGVPEDLAARWNSAARGNLLAACPGLATALPPGVRLATEADRAAVRGAQHSPYIHRISAPVANTAGDRVLIEVASQCAGLCGSGLVRHFRKTARGWVEEPYAGMWLS